MWSALWFTITGGRAVPWPNARRWRGPSWPRRCSTSCVGLPDPFHGSGAQANSADDADADRASSRRPDAATPVRLVPARRGSERGDVLARLRRIRREPVALAPARGSDPTHPGGAADRAYRPRQHRHRGARNAPTPRQAPRSRARASSPPARASCAGARPRRPESRAGSNVKGP